MNRKQRSERVLIVDDTSSNLVLLNEMLSGAGFAVSVATNGADALESARLAPPDMVLLDILMPGMDGYEVLAELKADKTTCAIPVLLLSALDEPDSKTKGFELGACDYVTKPFHLVEVLARMSTHLRVADLERRLRWSEGAMREGERIARMGTWTRQIASGKMEWSDELFGLFGVDRTTNLSIAEILEQAVSVDDLRRVKEVFADPVGTLDPDRCVDFALRAEGTQERRLRAMGRKSVEMATPGLDVFVGVVLDVTRIVRDHQDDLSRSRGHQRVLDLHPDPYLRMDGRGRILEANEALAHLLGRDVRKLPGEGLAILDATDSVPGSLLESVHRGLNSGLHRVSARVGTREGDRRSELTVVPLDGTGSDLALFLRILDDPRAAE